MTLIVNHFGLADCRIDVNRRKRGRAHPQYTCRAGQKRFSRKSGHFRQAVYCSSNIPGSSQLVIKIQKLMLRVRLVKQPVIYRLPFHGPIHADRWQKRKACLFQKRVIALGTYFVLILWYLLFGFWVVGFTLFWFDFLNGQFDNSFGQEEQDGKQTRFFWIFVNFVSWVGESISGWMNSCCLVLKKEMMIWSLAWTCWS